MLFPVDSILPEGFTYIPDFINKEEEIWLCNEIEKLDLHTFIFQGYEAKRKVASYGFDWSFEKRILTKGKKIPASFNFLVNRVADHLSVKGEDIAELLVTEYPIGSVINWHRDAPPFDIIAGISLLSDCKFRLRPYDKKKQERKSIISLPVKRRSFYVMQGDARSEWEHSITPMKEKRYSITLRTLKDK